MRLILLAFGLLFSCAILRGQQISLESLGGPRGADILEFNLNNDGDILVFQNNVGFVFSNDKGQTWIEINSTFDRAKFEGEILAHPNGNFYITNEDDSDKIFLFDIQDSSLNAINIGSLGILSDLVINDDSGTLYFLSTEGDIFSSIDNGNSWILKRSLNCTFRFWPKWMTPSHFEESIYLIKYFNTDKKYGILEVSCDNSQIDTLAFRAVNIRQIREIQSDSLWIGTNRGLFQINKNSTSFNVLGDLRWDVFELINLNNGNTRFSESGRMVVDKNSNAVFILNENALQSNFVKIDYDFTNPIPIIPLLNPLNISSINKLDNDVFIVGSGSSFSIPTNFYISRDKGNSFDPLLIDDRGILHLDIGGNSTIYALCENDTLYRSIDKGITWQNINFSGIQGSFTTLSFLKAGESNYVFGQITEDLNDDPTSGEKTTTIYSNDSGDTWQEITIDSVLTLSNKNVQLDIEGNIYQTTTLSNEIYKFHSNKGVWEIIHNDQRTQNGFWLGVKDSLNILVHGFYNNKNIITNTNDGFQTDAINQISNFSSIRTQLVQNHFLLSNTDDEVIISQNDALSWETLFNRDTFSFPQPIRSVYLDDENYIYVSFDGGVLHKSTTPLLLNNNFIIGKVQIDENQNCLNDSTELGMPNIIVSAEGQDTFFVNTSANGDFKILVPDGTYEVSITVDTSLWEPCDPFQTVVMTGTYDTTFVDFSVKAKIDCPKLEVDLTTPRLRRCFDNSYSVYYKNEGTIATDTPFVKITLDPRFDITQATIPFLVENDSCYIFPLDTLDLFEDGDFSFVTEMDCNAVVLGETICAEAHIFPDSICGTPSANWSGASLESTAECIGDSIIFKIKNIGNGDMTQGRQFIIIEDVVIMRISPTFNLPAGDSLRIPIEATGPTYHLEVPQVDNHPGQSHPSVTVESCGLPPHSMGLFNQFPQNDNNQFIDIECREVIGSYDPNDKAAVPRGIDVEHKIQPNSTIEYLIRFQNTGTDTAFSVNIIDTLSRWLDVPSFQAGASSHSYEYEISGEGTVRFIFNNIMLPDSNINEPASNGFIKYKIAMKADPPVGTEILNEADIYFDFNAPIRTNETFHVIDEPWVLVKTSEVFVPGVEVNAYPNPFQHQATIKLSNAVTGQKKFRLFDLSGRQMRQQYFDSDQFIFEKQSLPNGVYFYEISGGGTKIAVGKLIIHNP